MIIYIINMFILPPGLSDNDVKLIMKLYETGSQINRTSDQDVESKENVELQKNVESKEDVEKRELKKQIVNHLAKNPSTSLSSLMAYSMIFRE